MAHILVIDDHPHVRDLFRDVLEDDGYRVTVAADGYDGIQSCRGALPDLVIVDLQMPGQDGLDTIRQLRAAHHELPIIAMSGGNHDHGVNVLETAQGLGAVRTFEKPISLTEFGTLVRDVLRSSDTREPGRDPGGRCPSRFRPPP